MALILGECRIRQLREAKGLTQIALSDAIKKRHGISISKTLISQYEIGLKTPGPLNSRAICLILGCMESELYDFIET